MAFEINDLKGILILVLFAIPMVASTNINCSGRAFHCVNSTHFMICVDLGGGLSTTIDNFVIPCPDTTVCHENNVFECDFPEVTTPPPPLQVIGVYKQSDTSESTLVTNSVSALTPASEIFSVFKENITATTLSIPEDVTPVLKLEVLENIKDPVGVNSIDTTEASFTVTPSFNDSKNEVVNDKKTSNKTITISATDTNNHLDPAVETSIHKQVITSSTDKSKSIDTVTSVIGLINLISTDHPSVVNTKPSFDLFTSLDTLYDNIATTTEQYITKQVTTLGEKVGNITEKIIIPTEVIFNERSVNTDEVSTTPVENTYIESDINNGSGSPKTAEGNSLGKSNTSELVPETTTEYLAPINIVNISEPITVDLSLQTTTDNTFVPLRLVDLISADPKQNAPSTNDYINTFHGNTATTTTDQYTTKLETTLSDKLVTTEVIRTTPIINTIFQNVLKNDANKDSLTELNLTVEITSTKKAPEMNNNYFIPELMTIGNQQTTTEKTFVSITTEANIMYNTETTPTSRDLIKNVSIVEKHTTATQPLEIIITTSSPIELTDNLYQINREFNQTSVTTKNNTTDTINTTERVESLFNASSTDIVNNQVTEPTSLLPTTMKNPAIELTTAETLHNGFTAHAIEAKNEVSATNDPMSVNDANLENGGINTLLSVHTTPAHYNVALDSVANTTGKDFISQSDIVTNPQIGFTAEIIAHKFSEGSVSIDHETTQKVTTDPETKISDSLNQSENLGIVSLPENFNADHLTKTVVDKDVVGMPPTYWKNVKNSASTPFPSDVTGKISLSDSVKSVNQDNISAKNYVKTQDVLINTVLPQAPSIIYYVSEFASTTPITVQTTPISIDTMKISEQLSSYNPEMVDIYRAFTTGNKIDTSTTLPVDVTHKTNIENVTDIPVTTQPPQESTSQKIGTVKQLNTTSITETVSDLLPFTDTTAGYVVHNTTNLNTSGWKDSVNIDTESSKADPNADVNKTEIVKPINGKNSDNANSPSPTIKVENITIVSVFDIVNSSVNAMLNKTLQPTSSNPSLSNDYIKTTESNDSSAYVTATSNVPDYNLVQAGELFTRKNPEGIVSFAQTNAMNSILSTPSTYTLPITEINTEKVQYVGTEAPLPSTVELKHLNPTKTAVHYVTEKTNDYISSREAIPTKLPKVETESSVSSVRSVAPSTVVTSDEFTTVPVYDEVTTIKDSAFIMSSTQISLKVVMDKNIKIRTESPLLTSKVEAQTDQYITESSLPISELPIAQVTTEPTHTTNIFAQPTSLASIGKTNLDVLTGIKTTDLPQNVLSTVNNNIPQSMSSIPILGLTAAQMTTEPTHTTNGFAQTTPLLVAAGNTNQGGIKITDLPQYVTTPVSYNNTQWISDITTEVINGSLTVPDSMVETIKVVGDKVSGTYLGETSLSNVMSNNPTVNDANYSVKSVIHIIDHESIVVGTTSKNNEQNTPITSAKSMDINKAEVVNHTESNWMRSDVNIDSVKIKESSIEEEDSKSSVLKYGADVQNQTLVSDSSLISKIETKDLIPVDKIEYRLTTVVINHKETESDTPKNVMQSKTIITNENKNAEINSKVSANTEIIDVKKYQVQVESKNISDGNNINNTIANITTSQHKLSLQKSTTNDELEQHLISTNHTITTEVQSHLDDELTLNGTSMNNPNLTSIKLNAGNDTSSITVSTLVFNCSNHTRGKYADKIDCRKFYTCIGNLTPILGTCPNNTVFSEISKQCTRNLSHCVRNNQFRCLFEGRFSDFFNDNIYYICVKNRMNGFIRYKLQCQDDYYLNKESVKCEKIEEVSIQSPFSVSETNNDERKPQPKSEKIVSTDDFECANEGKFPYAKDCSKYDVCNEIKNVYYICVKNRMNGFIRYKLQCQDDYHLNKDSVKCEKNQEISTQSASSLSETNNEESKPQPKSEKMVSTDDFECENEGKFSYAKDCSKYYVCTKIKNVYRRKIKKCTSEEVFDKEKKKCVESDSGEC